MATVSSANMNGIPSAPPSAITALDAASFNAEKALEIPHLLASESDRPYIPSPLVLGDSGIGTRIDSAH